MKNQQEREVVDSFVSPSFSSYTSDKLADIADQVNRDYFRALEPQNDAANGFEFVTLQEASGEVFFDGYVGPVFPVFNRDLLTLYESDVGKGHARDSNAEEDVMALQLPMRKLLILDEDRHCRPDPQSSSSSSSSEVDDFEEISSGTYCVWTPKCAKASPSRHKKSNSAGSSSSSSKRWKFLDLLRRSNSDGKNSYVFLSPSSSGSNLVKKKEVKRENSKEQWSSTKVAEQQKPRRAAAATGGEKNVSAHEALYLRNKELRKGNKKKSYLPYRQDLIGFWASL